MTTYRINQRSRWMRIFLFLGVGIGVVALLAQTSYGALALWYVRQPFTLLWDSGNRSFQNVRAILGGATQLHESIAQLRTENTRLHSEVARLQAIEQENAALRNTLQLPTHAPHARYRVQTAADRIGFDIGGKKEWLLINRGTADGVMEGAAVVTTDGIFIGTIASCATHTARVLLLTHADSALRAQTTQHAVTGIVRGISGVGMRLTMVEQNATLSDGESLVTTQNGMIPGGILIGTIHDIQTSSDHLFREATVVPAYTYDHVRIVNVLDTQTHQ